MSLYKAKADHSKVKAGDGDLEDFFTWALSLCRRDKVKNVVVETVGFRVTWDAKRAKKQRKAATQPIKQVKP